MSPHISPESYRPQVEAALRVLDVHEFDTKTLWLELSKRSGAFDRGVPSIDDFKYTCPTVAPDIATHFVGGSPQELSAGCMWAGYSYELTPGQRMVLRDAYGLTPTQTVTIDWVEFWPNTAHPRCIKLSSDIHIDPRNRKHVLTSCIIREVAAFFTQGEALDAQVETERRFGLTDSSLTIGRLFTMSSDERWAVEDLSGVKITSKVEITHVSPDVFTVMCQKTGNSAKVKRADYFKLVEEYETIHQSRSPRAKRAQKHSTLAEVMASLSL